MHTRRARSLLLASIPTAALLLGAGGCTEGEGALSLVVNGEETATEGIPNDEVAFADGWTVEFDKYIVSFGNLTLRGAEGGLEADMVYVADLHRGAPEVELFEALAAQRWDSFNFEIVPPTDEVINANGVDEADIQLMRDMGYNYWIEGRAQKGDVELHFAWGLQNPTYNRDCTNGIDDTQGVVIRNSGTSTAEITIHTEHMFWTTLGIHESELRFDAIAAMADAEGEIPFDALEGQLLANLQDAEGNPLMDGSGNPVVYDPASVALPADNLKEFILAATATQAHLNGAGLCTVERM